MGRQRGNPGLGTKMLSPSSHIAEIALKRAPEHPKAKTTSFSVNGKSGCENLKWRYNDE